VIHRIDDAPARHEDRDRAGGKQHPAPITGILLEIVHAAFHRAKAETVDDEEGLELGLDDEEAAEAGPHDRAGARRVPVAGIGRFPAAQHG